MTTATPAPDASGIAELDRAAGHELLNEAAEHYLGLSGEDFMLRWDAGEFDHDPDRPEVVRVAMLLPFGR